MIPVAEHPEFAQDRPVKRRRANKSAAAVVQEKAQKDEGSSASTEPKREEEEDEDIDKLFEDVDIDAPRPPALVTSASQTIEMSDYDSDSDEEFEDIDVDAPTFQPRQDASEDEKETGDFDLNLTHAADTTPQRAPRKKARIFSKQERAHHIITHKMHMLCLLRSLKIRNKWCNDEIVQATMKRLLSPKDRQWFKTKLEWTQFRRAESIKKGLDIAGKVFLASFKITARGMRRAYWDDETSKFEMPPDADPVLDIEDFRDAALNMEGSRDVGAMLYCALLRACGLDVRLVCSLQLLPINAGSKSRPPLRGISVSRPTTPAPTAATPKPEMDTGNSIAAIRARSRVDPFAGPASTSPRPSPKPKKKVILESPFPVFWVEVLDSAHQRWLPVDPLVTQTIDKRLKFEPPASDAENNMIYVTAFDADSHLRDVTGRYTTWYLAKTRKQRLEITPGGEAWLQKVIAHYSRGWTTDLDAVEDTELSNFEAREKMPTAISDFKDHPRYVLERDLRRNEVLVQPLHEVAKVRAGKSGKMESVYRRSDVRTVRSADGWYRHAGREVKAGEQPVKVRAARKVKGEELEDGEGEGVVALYTEEQTEPYEAPPVVNGRVPRNVYGNLDVYVPSMVPKGGVHLEYPDTARAAKVLGIDYADAVTGFEFRGRHGTAVVKGAVVAEEYKEAVEAVIEGFRDEEREMAERRRRLIALRMWKRFMVGLRIKERVDTYKEEGEDDSDSDIYMKDAEDDGKGMESEEFDMDEPGGFLHDDDGGGFIPE